MTSYEKMIVSLHAEVETEMELFYRALEKGTERRLQRAREKAACKGDAQEAKAPAGDA